MDYTSQQFLGVFFIHSYLHSPWIFHIFSVFKLLGWWRGFLIHWEKNQKSNSIGYQDISPLCCVAQSCLTLCDAVNCSPPSSFVHGIILARTLEWVAISYSRGSSWLRDQTRVSWGSCIGRQILFALSHLGSPSTYLHLAKKIFYLLFYSYNMSMFLAKASTSLIF